MFTVFCNKEFIQNMLLKSLKISIFLLYLSGMNVKFFEHQLKLLITSVIEPKFKSKPPETIKREVFKLTVLPLLLKIFNDCKFELL